MHTERNLCFCPLKGIIDTISKKWALLIINAIGNHEVLRFNQLMEELKGISPKSLSDTLKQLEKEQLIIKKSFAEIPPRVEYSLTKDGIELRKAIIPLLQWASKRSSQRICPSRFRGLPGHKVKGENISFIEIRDTGFDCIGKE